MEARAFLYVLLLNSHSESNYTQVRYYLTVIHQMRLFNHQRARTSANDLQRTHISTQQHKLLSDNSMIIIQLPLLLRKGVLS